MEGESRKIVNSKEFITVGHMLAKNFVAIQILEFFRSHLNLSDLNQRLHHQIVVKPRRYVFHNN